MIRKVLFFQATNGMFSSRRQSGAERIAVTDGWYFHTIWYSLRPDGTVRTHRFGGVPSLANIVRRWTDLDGVIVECNDAGAGIDGDLLGDLPAVFINPAAPPRGQHRGSVLLDQGSFATIAARELFASGYADYAFIPSATDRPWSHERGAAFAAAVRAAGKRFHRLRLPNGAVTDEQLLELCVPWLASLPKPIGVFGANDISARAVADACGRLGFSIPGDVAVIGVDDRRDICEGASPAITSILQDFEGEGLAAASLLAKMMEDPERDFSPLKFGCGNVVRRETTDFESARQLDVRIVRAQEFIRQNACSGIVPGDVARAMFVSRAVADAAFRKATGGTILAAIHAARLAKAQDMLALGTSPDIVAQSCGYASVNDFRRVFRHRLGTTVRRFLKGLHTTRD